jgi:xanthine dehydrogenase accessory factor
LADQKIAANTVICVLTHDPKFDIPVLKIALRSNAAYVGAMGSRKTHQDRLDRLAQAGLSDAEIARLRSPIGLDLGGRSPQETALSILAEVVMVRESRSGLPLSETEGTIHP